jgi:hypothetical protein
MRKKLYNAKPDKKEGDSNTAFYSQMILKFSKQDDKTQQVKHRLRKYMAIYSSL